VISYRYLLEEHLKVFVVPRRPLRTALAVDAPVTGVAVDAPVTGVTVDAPVAGVAVDAPVAGVVNR
jgi:hypothetical protein